MPTTASPISIYFTDPSQPGSSENESATQASSIHNQFALRERYDFQWANDAERQAQTGMVQGSRGYQSNTRSEYLFDSAAWRLAVPHTEWTFTSAANAAGGVNPVGPFQIDAATSTSQNQAAASSTPKSGQIIIADPGVYAYSATLGSVGSPAPGFSGRTFLDLSYSSDTSLAPPIVNRTSIAVGEDRGTITVPNLRTTIPNQPIFLSYFHSNSTTISVSGRARLTRLG